VTKAKDTMIPFTYLREWFATVPTNNRNGVKQANLAYRAAGPSRPEQDRRVGGQDAQVGSPGGENGLCAGS
jgi:hypothetical protein